MVFTVNSNEHTQKVCLSSRLAENYPSANPKFIFRTPIKAPWNVVSMVCLESAILQAPSMFTPNIINDESNQFKRYIDISPDAGTTSNIQDYWSTKNATLVDGTTNAQTNTRPIKDILQHTINANMSLIDLVAKFFCEFIFQTKAFRLYLGPYTLDSEGSPVYTTYPGDARPAYINWTMDDDGNEYLEGYVAEDGPYPGSIDNPIIWPMLSMKLQRNQTRTCTLVPLSRLNGIMLSQKALKKLKVVIRLQYLVLIPTQQNFDSLENG